MVNIGPDEEFISINALFRLLKDITGFEGQAIHLKDRPQEVKHAFCSSASARDAAGLSHHPQRWTTGCATSWATSASVGPRKFRYHLDIEIRTERTPRTWTERLM